MGAFPIMMVHLYQLKKSKDTHPMGGPKYERQYSYGYQLPPLCTWCRLLGITLCDPPPSSMGGATPDAATINILCELVTGAGVCAVLHTSSH